MDELKEKSESEHKIHEVSFWQLMVLLPLSIVLKIWLKTLRFTVDEQSLEALRYDEKPPMQLLWHNRLFIAAVVRRRFGNNKTQCAALISASKDGAWLAALYQLLGIKPIRGSSSWRGGAALKEAVRIMEDGYDLAITPDGPRGPCYTITDGPANIAKHSACSIILASATFHRSKRLNSWDGFYVPYPFSRITLRAICYANLDAMLEANNTEPEDATMLIRKKLLALNESQVGRVISNQ